MLKGSGKASKMSHGNVTYSFHNKFFLLDFVNVLRNIFRPLQTFFLLLQNAAVNNGLHQLLGLRLRFCLRGKYSDIFNFIFQINFVDLFWSVSAAATECKPQTLTAILFTRKMESSKLSNSKLILSGLFIVNIPVTIIILLSIYLLTTYTNFRFTESVIIGAAIGWIYWEFGSRFWIKWALEKGVEKNRLHKIGIMSLVLWQSDLKKIEEIESNLSKNQ